MDVCGVSGLGQPALGAGLTLGGLLSSSTLPTAPVAAPHGVGLGGVDFSSSSEKKSDKLSGARPEWVWNTPVQHAFILWCCDNYCNLFVFASCRDSKALKDENLPAPICQDVDNFQ